MSNNGKFVNRISRQVSRKEQRDDFKQRNAQQKILNSPATRRELFLLQQQIANLELTIDTFHRIIIKKKIMTQEELLEFHESAQARDSEFSKIQQSSGDYKKRLDICIKYEIPIEKTIIPTQLKNDDDLTKDEKMELCVNYQIPHSLIIPPEQKSKK